MAFNRKNISRDEVLQYLQNHPINLPPLSLQWAEMEPNLSSFQPDAILVDKWENIGLRFLVVCRASWTPKAFAAGLDRLKAMSLPSGIFPLLCLPYLDDMKLQELERQGISGVDLCGNGVVITPGLVVYRTGQSKQFTSSEPIKNVYRRNSSLVGRVFLARPTFASVGEIREEISRLNLLANRSPGSSLGLPTVSKALKNLEEDLIITRGDGISLKKPEKLLEKLAWNFSPAAATRRFSLKVADLEQKLRDLTAQAEAANIPLMISGSSSAGQYGAAQHGYLMTVYCTDLEWLRTRLPEARTDRFPNLEIIETREARHYFDCRENDGLRWASPVQTYLELMHGDEHDREAAEQVRQHILQKPEQKAREPVMDF